MGIIIRQSFKGALVQYIGVGLGYVNLIILFPLCLSLELNGLTRFLLEMGATLAMFAQLGLPNGIARFYVRYKKTKEGLGNFNSLVLGIVLISTILSLVAMLVFRDIFVSSFKENAELVDQYYWYILYISIAGVIIAILEQYCASNYRLTVPKIIREIGIRLIIGLGLLCYYFHYISFEELIILIVFSYVFFAFVLFLYTNYLSKFTFSIKKEHFKSELSKQLYWFLGLTILSGLGANIVSKIDFYMISSLINLENLAIYGTAIYIMTLMEIPSRMINQISTPIISEHLDEGRIDKVKQWYISSSNNQFIIGSVLFLLLFYNTPNLIAIMPNGNNFIELTSLVFILGLGKLVGLVLSNASVVLGNSKYYYYGLYFIIFLAIITVLTNLYFIERFGLNGVAIATSISSIIYFMIIAIFTKIKFGMQPVTKKTIIVLGATVANILVFIFLPNPANHYLNIIFVSCLAILNLVLFYILNLSIELNSFIKSILKKLTH